jgi:hypothetical protein
MPSWQVLVAILWLVVLVGSVPLYAHWHWLRRNFSDPAGPIPLGVVWWGALGGLTVSLVGISTHATKWDPGFNLWHPLRPIVGAIVGPVAYLIYITAIKASGNPVANGQSNQAVYILVAFITAYREDTFRELISRAIQVLLGPGDGKTGTTEASAKKN